MLMGRLVSALEHEVPPNGGREETARIVALWTALAIAAGEGPPPLDLLGDDLLWLVPRGA
jgi:hypothetical protein